MICWPKALPPEHPNGGLSMPINPLSIQLQLMRPTWPRSTPICTRFTKQTRSANWRNCGVSRACPAPVGGFVTVDQKQPDQYVTYVGSRGLGLPDRQYYLDETEKGVEIQQKYRDYLTFLFT